MNNKGIVRISNAKGGLLGTGFVVGSCSEHLYVATCNHVIEDVPLEDCRINGSEIEIVVPGENEVDLVILSLKGGDLPIFSLSLSNERSSGNIVGYTNLLDDVKLEPINSVKIKEGIEIGGVDNNNAPKYLGLYLDEPIDDGYSGAPLLCESSLQVLGVVCIRKSSEKAYAIDVSHLSELVDSAIPQQTSRIRPTVNNFKRRHLDTSEFPNMGPELEQRFLAALTSYERQPRVWVEPRLHTKPEHLVTDTTTDDEIKSSNMLSSLSSRAIFAKQQFGLSSLAHYLVKEAWSRSPSSYWHYIDASTLKPHYKEIEKKINRDLNKLGINIESVEAVVLDELSDNIKGGGKILKAISDLFSDRPIVVMITIIDKPHFDELGDALECRHFQKNFLWGLTRSDLRNIIVEYNKEQYISDDDNLVVEKVVNDLDVLNIPRTPLNCITLLKISENSFDDSPVNRTEMIKRVLHLLFNADHIPKYKTRPDLKDTEYILGYYCEKLIRNRINYFERTTFLLDLNTFCQENEIDLDVEVIFDVLEKNGILVPRGNLFCFKFAYWVFYFAAHRMHHDKDFESFILSDMHYASYPELIEFYTGIDRRRSEALEILINDISDVRKVVEEKCGLPENFNIYDEASWDPTPEAIELMQNEISKGILSSNLPDSIKDDYADQGYSRTKSHNQEITRILEEYSLARLMKSISACSIALRNSDYAPPELKHRLLEEVLDCWNQLVDVLVLVSPALAENGEVSIDGATFCLSTDFDGTPEENFYELLGLIPANIVNWYRDELFSHKMGPLIHKHSERDLSAQTRHNLNLFLIKKRPKNWDKKIRDYIAQEDKNSFYLYDVYRSLRTEYRYSFATPKSVKALESLIKATAAKHDLGIQSLGKRKLSNISDKVLPQRRV